MPLTLIQARLKASDLRARCDFFKYSIENWEFLSTALAHPDKLDRLMQDAAVTSNLGRDINNFLARNAFLMKGKIPAYDRYPLSASLWERLRYANENGLVGTPGCSAVVRDMALCAGVKYMANYYIQLILAEKGVPEESKRNSIIHLAKMPTQNGIPACDPRLTNYLKEFNSIMSAPILVGIADKQTPDLKDVVSLVVKLTIAQDIPHQNELLLFLHDMKANVDNATWNNKGKFNSEPPAHIVSLRQKLTNLPAQLSESKEIDQLKANAKSVRDDIADAIRNPKCGRVPVTREFYLGQKTILDTFLADEKATAAQHGAGAGPGIDTTRYEAKRG